MLSAEICWCEGRWLCSDSIVILDLEGGVIPQDGWEKEESAYDLSPPGVGHEAESGGESPLSL